jgi:hypothetical protein
MIRRAPEIDVGNIVVESAGKQEVMVVGPLIQRDVQAPEMIDA